MICDACKQIGKSRLVFVPFQPYAKFVSRFCVQYFSLYFLIHTINF